MKIKYVLKRHVSAFINFTFSSGEKTECKVSISSYSYTYKISKSEQYIFTCFCKR